MCISQPLQHMKLELIKFDTNGTDLENVTVENVDRV